MSDIDQGEKKTQRNIFAQRRVALTRLNMGVRRFYKELASGIRWTLTTLLSVLIIISLILFISKGIYSGSTPKEVSKKIIIQQASERIHQIVDAISNLRDTVCTDSVFAEQLKIDASQSALFETIHILDSLKGNKFSVILPLLASEKYSFIQGRGVAYYDDMKRLTAWNSSSSGTANFDSLFSYAGLLEKHSKALFVGTEQIFTWVVAIRKVISKDGVLLGYVTAKAMIGERYPLGGSDQHPLTIFDDIIAKSGREIRFSFSSSQIDTPVSISLYPLFFDDNDSSSILGYLNIADAPVFQQTGLLKIIQGVRDIAFVLFILILFWLASWHVAQIGAKSEILSSKLFLSGSVFVILGIGRILLLITDSLGVIVPQGLQDPQDFALPYVSGLLSNPLQLFTTILFITTFFILTWVIFIPQRAYWKTSLIGHESATFSTTQWLLRILTILCILLLLPLVNLLFAFVISSLVENGSYHYLGNRFGFTRGSFILMEASFLLVGVSYFFCSMLILLQTLRSMIQITASELSPSRSYLTHYILFTIIATVTVWMLSPNSISIYPDIYWGAICFMLCVITTIIFSRDVAALRSEQPGPSYFYRMPRSGLALLFLLTGAGFLLSPLIATQEYANDIEIVKHNLSQNSQVNDLNYSSFLDQTFLSFTSEETLPVLFPMGASSDIKNLAFNIWLKQLPEAVNQNVVVVIEVKDLYGKTLSRFIQNATIDDEARLATTRDSLFAAVQIQYNHNSSEKTYLLGSVPCFTISCTPAYIGAGLVTFLTSKGHHSFYPVDSSIRPKFLISISLWNDPFPQTAVHSLYDIVRSPGTTTEKPSWQYHGFFYGEYQNGSLQNFSTTEVELPSHISPTVDTLLKRKEFVVSEGQIDGKRSYTIYHRIGDERTSGNRLMAAMIFIPGVNSLIELTLSLNTVSLFIGFFVIFFALLVRSLFSKGKRGTLKFRDRIFLIVLTIALVPLIIVTNITRSLLIEREQRIEREHLQHDASIVAERLQRTFSHPDSASNIHLNALLSDLSHTIGRDISFYNERGILFATNRPELYESSLLPNEISSETIRQIFKHQKSFVVEPLASGPGSFDIGYKTIMRSDNGSLKGIVGVTSFRGMQTIEADIARTIELMYGAFSALGIILLLIGAWISVRVAAPIQQLIAATERVTQGRLETIVTIKRKDEVGELAQAFNRMTGELERTRENVAQSEREGAWKEMARQVAHEIKNPLTPMKLSVQHVEHAYESGDTNFGSVFRRVIRTLSEQIDVLTRIATEFSRFGEMPRRKYGFVSLKKIAESAMALYDAERGRVRFVVDIPSDLPPIYADDEEFRRALVNLIRNSLQATEGWGVILIRAREKSGLIHLDFTDTGGGMTSETLKKAFDPNFSTKTSGMGLGLAIVKKIVTDMSGTITVESMLGKGTTFHIELPAREYPAQ